MTLPKNLTTITPLSKAIAMALFILLPFVGFKLGMKYERARTSPPIDDGNAGCTLDAKICPDGSAVGRVGPSCEFAPCPKIAPEQQMCGGIAGLPCPDGYTCKLDGTYPDAAGTCVKSAKRGTGTLQATVLFIGTPCMPGTGTVPSCDGPYPMYKTIIWDAAGEKQVASGITDELGTLTLQLAPGTYQWINENGIPGGGKSAGVTFSIRAGETTRTEFAVDTGVR